MKRRLSEGWALKKQGLIDKDTIEHSDEEKDKEVQDKKTALREGLKRRKSNVGIECDNGDVPEIKLIKRTVGR